MAGSQVFDKAPTTQHGQAIEGGAGSRPPAANPIAVGTDPVTGAAIIRQTEAPVEVASGVTGANVIPADKVGNAQELAPLRGPKGPPLTGKALVAAVGAKRAAEIERAQAHGSPGTQTNPTPSQQPGPAPAPPEPTQPIVSAAGALSQSAQQVGLRRPQRRSAPPPSVTTTPVESTTEAPAPPAAPAPPESGSTDTDDTVDVAQHLVEDVPLAPIQPHQKAASNTDSPSRGLPTPITDPGKKITGGFGELTDGQYHPLNGQELKALVEALMDTVHGQLQDDLRFSMALTYPRVRARVQIIVEGYAEADSFAIERLKPEPPNGKPGSTPLALAQQLGDQIVFVVVAERREMDDAGNPVASSAPNALRQELGLEVPRKQRIETPTGWTLADRKTQ